MLCWGCGTREARCIVTSCNGQECYELRLCLQCHAARNEFLEGAVPSRLLKNRVILTDGGNAGDRVISEARRMWSHI